MTIGNEALVASPVASSARAMRCPVLTNAFAASRDLCASATPRSPVLTQIEWWSKKGLNPQSKGVNLRVPFVWYASLLTCVAMRSPVLP
eukprot:2645116-Rhodomonas_salina.2